MSRRRSLPSPGDVLVGVGTAAFVVAVTGNIPPAPGERGVDGLAVALMVVAGGALAFRRRAPRAVLAVVAVVLTVYTRRLYAGGPVYLTLFVAIYTLSLYVRDRRQVLLTVAGTVVVMVLTGTIGMASIEWTWHVVAFPGWAAAAVFLGDAHRNRRDYLRGLEERARTLEETREEEARRRVAEERLRIARDLHDVVAHTIATISVQSGVAAHVLDRRPEQAAEALEAIRRASGDALQELRATLDVLRSDGDGDDAAPRAPTPGLDRVDELAASAGLPVGVERAGELPDLPPAVDVAAYRIVQESLTNVMRHAHASRATVSISASGGRLRLVVTDDGRGAAATARDGHGIAGMRERAALVGGTLDAGPRPGGGFRVEAVLPLAGAR